MKFLKLTTIFIFSFITGTSFAQNAESTSRVIVGRETQLINSNWEFKKSIDNAQWTKVDVPHTWNNIDMQLGKDFYEGDAQYKKQLYLGQEYKNKRMFLRFEGVGSVAKVYVNNKLVGKHKGSYSAFCVEITYAVKLNEENTILVEVNNQARKDVLPVNHFLFGIYGGIYRPVSLITTNKINISTTDYASPGVYITQKNVTQQSAQIGVEVKVENKEKTFQDLQIISTVYDADGNVVYTHKTKENCSPQGRQSFKHAFELKNPHLWQGLDDPYLYTLKVSLMQNDDLLDEIEQPLGIRRFEIIAGKGFFLNGKKYNMYGVCRHQDRWQFGNALSNEQHKEDLDIIKEMGATTIRFAHYQQAEYMYSLCDKTGMVVWAEIPFVNRSTGEEAENAKQQITELIKQNFNHPSIYAWGLHNEVYGKTPADYVPSVTRDLNDIAKTLDPDRYTASVSGYPEMDRPANLNTDIQGINRYFGWYEGQISDLDKWATDMKKDFPNYKMILAEYGADGNVFHQQETATLPNKWDYTSPFYPETFETKTHELQWPIIAKHPYITASYIWNMFDFNVPMWNRGGMNALNMKGLVTFDRKLKKDVFYWYKANWSKEPVLYLTERRVTDRKNADTEIRLYSNIGQPKVYLNGKKVTAKPKIDETKVLYIYPVKLKKGKNVIETKTTKDKKVFTDKIVWTLK